jgi:hypothetical protein
MTTLYAVLCPDGHVVAPFASSEIAGEWIGEDCDVNGTDVDYYEIHPFTPSDDGGLCNE